MGHSVSPEWASIDHVVAFGSTQIKCKWVCLALDVMWLLKSSLGVTDLYTVMQLCVYSNVCLKYVTQQHTSF